MLVHEIITAAKQVHGDKYNYDKVVAAWRHEKITITCPEHGDFEQTIHRHISAGRGCRKCGGSALLTRDETIAQFREVHGDRYDYSKLIYVNSKQHVTIICREHGEFSQSPAKHKKGANCPKCVGGKQLTQDDFVRKSRKKHGDKYDYSKAVYTRAKQSVVIICPKHGEFTQIANGHLSGYGCSKCAADVRKQNQPKALAKFIRDARRVHGNKYNYDKTVYIRANAKVIITCPEHGDFEQLAANHINCANGCPHCNFNGTSRAEQKLYEQYPQAIQHDRSILGTHEIDMVLGSVAVEVNGMYWHTEAKGKGEMYHKSKTLGAAKQGIQLLHFTDKEVQTKFDLVCSMINMKAEVSDHTRIYARKCQVAELTHKEAEKFLQDNHMQGSCVSSVRYGLQHEGELVAVMTFIKARFTPSCKWELLRFATKLNTQVVGGASKLLKSFRKAYDGSVVSYANLRWSNGALYEALGFTFSHESRPNYVWVSSNGSLTYSRNNTQKHKLSTLLGDKFDAGLSETGNMEAQGFSRLWDCGNRVYILN